jgi:hypothetical protein
MTAQQTPSTRQAAALERAAFRVTLTPLQQAARLDRRLGKGQGAKKERARLALGTPNPD